MSLADDLRVIGERADADRAALVSERDDLAAKLATATARIAELEGQQPPPVQGGVVAMWHHAWQGPVPWTGYPANVRAQLGSISLGMAQSAQAGTGRLTYFNRHGAALAQGIAAAKQAGVPVLMGVGGSSDGGITVTNTAQADQLFASLQGYVSAFGISGMDFDLEPSGSHWSQDAVVYLFRKLKATFPGWVNVITPGLYGSYTARWMALTQALGDGYDLIAPMLYDFPEAADSRLTAVALDKCRVMKAAGIPESKMILGFMTAPPGGRPNCSTPALTAAAWRACKAAFPGLRGAFLWEDGIDNSNGWAWTATMAPLIRPQAA